MTHLPIELVARSRGWTHSQSNPKDEGQPHDTSFADFPFWPPLSQRRSPSRMHKEVEAALVEAVVVPAAEARAVLPARAPPVQWAAGPEAA